MSDGTLPSPHPFMLRCVRMQLAAMGIPFLGCMPADKVRHEI